MAKLIRILLVVFLFLQFSSPAQAAVDPVPTLPTAGRSCGTVTIRSTDPAGADIITQGLPFELNIVPNLLDNDGDPNTPTTPSLPTGFYTLIYYDDNGSYTRLGQANVSDASTKVGTFIFTPTTTGPTTIFFKKDLSKPEVCTITLSVTPGYTYNCETADSDSSSENDCGSVDTGIGNLSANPGVLANRLLAIGISIAGGVALIIMIVAAYKIISSRGNPEQLQNGRDLFTSAIIGILFLIFAVFILQLIGRDIIGIPGFSLVPAAYASPQVQVGEYWINPPAGLNPGFNSVGSVISAFLPAVLAFAGILAFIFLVLGGFRYLISRGDPKQVESARNTISGSLIGLVIIVGIFIIIAIIQAIFKITLLSLVPTAYAGGVDLGEAFKFGGQGVNTQFSGIGGLVSSLIAVIFPVAGVVFFFMLLWGGLKYMLSRGDDKATQSARSIITSALIGLLIIISSFLILYVIEAVTGLVITG